MTIRAYEYRRTIKLPVTAIYRYGFHSSCRTGEHKEWEETKASGLFYNEISKKQNSDAANSALAWTFGMTKITKHPHKISLSFATEKAP